MSLDKQIKEMAAKRVDDLVAECTRVLAAAVGAAPVGVRDVARLISEHKTKSTHDKAVKAVSEKISADMMASLEYDPAQDDS